MTALLIFVGVALLPVVLAFALGVGSVMVFLAVAAGVLLQQRLGESTTLALAAVVKNGPVDMIAALALLVLPLLLTVLFLRKSTKPRKLFVQLVPLLFTGCTFAFGVFAQLDATLQAQFRAERIGANLLQAADVLVALAIAMNLAWAWHAYRHKADSKHHR